MKSKKAKWLSEEALEIAVKRREVEGKGGKNTYVYIYIYIYVHPLECRVSMNSREK